MGSFRILEGVRRAKAAAMEGRTHIQAEVFNRNSQSLGIQEIALDALLSPKDAIDVSTPDLRSRFEQIRQAMQVGRQFPPISVTAGRRGRPLKDVLFDDQGEADD